MTRRTPGKRHKTHKIYLMQRINFKKTGSPTRLETRSSFLGRGYRLSYFPKVQAGSGAYPRSDSVDTWYSPRGHSGGGVKLIIYLHLMVRLRIYGVIPLLPTIPSRRGQGKIYLIYTHIKKDKFVCH